MIKHWRLFDDIQEQQITQLERSGMAVRVVNDMNELEFPDSGKVQFIVSSDVFITTATAMQETILKLMFAERVKLIGYNNDLS